MPVCPNCGEDNPERARFCLACATPLGVAPAERRETRRTVTVLFCDVAGSTTLGERLDPESLRAVMGRYFETARAVVERHGGTVEKFIGDAVMAVFGIPALHEDDALRAVRAAAELRDELAELSGELERERGVALSVRTGVNTGEVVAGDASTGQALVTGDTVNTAARLEQAAGPGEVLIGAATFRLVRDAVLVEEVEPLELKGKAARVPAFRLVAVTPGAAGVARRMDSPLVGRDRELRLLREAFERAEQDRACHLFTLLGAAGVGKSRLIEEFLAGLGDGARTLRGRCLSYGEGITYWPVVEVIRDVTEATEGDHAPELVDRLRTILGGDEEAAAVADRVGQLIGAEGSGSGDSAWAFRKVLEATARERPLVVVFDDIHWAEPSFLDLVEHVADWSRESPILLVCLARPELLDARPGWGGGKMNATSALLEPLSEEEIERLVDNLLGRTELEPEVRRRVTEAAEGNPLFVEEMLAMLVDDGLLRREGERWVAVGDLSAVAVPPSIQSLVAARLDRLADEERSVLERASVVGKVFWPGAVRDLSPEPARAAVPGALMTLVRKELIRPDRARFGGEEGFRFRHQLILDSAYEGMSKQARAELHEACAVWLEGMAGDRIEEYEEFLGYHLERSSRYLEELGGLDDRGRALADRAAGWLGAAGVRASARRDAHGAMNLLTRALALASDGPSVVRWRTELGVVQGLAGYIGSAQASLEAALSQAEATGDRSAAARASLDLAFIRMLNDPSIPQARLLEMAEDAVRTFRELADDEGSAYALLHLGEARFYLGDSRAANEAYAEAAELARRAGSLGLLIEAIGARLINGVFGSLSASEGLSLCEEAMATWPTDPGMRATATGAAAAYLGMLGRFDEGREHLVAAIRLMEDLGQQVRAANHLNMVGGELELAAGNLLEAERLTMDGAERLRAMGETGYFSTAAANVARVRLAQGRLDEAERWTVESERNAAPDDQASQLDWRLIRGIVVTRRGDPAAGEALIREALRFAEGMDYLNYQGDTYLALAEVLRMTGRAEEAAAALREALDRYERKENLVALERTRLLLAELDDG